MLDRWTVKECTSCGLVWPTSLMLCLDCARPLGELVDVVRAQGARTSDPDTSKLAALRQNPRSGSQRHRILGALRLNGPMTAREIAQDTGINGAWKRVSELKQGGHIHEAGTTFDPETGTEVTVYAVSVFATS